jgi:hypothetical protein
MTLKSNDKMKIADCTALHCLPPLETLDHLQKIKQKEPLRHAATSDSCDLFSRVTPRKKIVRLELPATDANIG